MFAPNDLYTLPQVMEKSSFTAAQILEMGIAGEVLFLVMGQGDRQGLCKLPQLALMEFRNGAETVAIESMPDVNSGELFGPCSIKRDGLRITVDSWDTFYAKWEAGVAEVDAETDQEEEEEEDGIDPRDDPIARPHYVDWNFWMLLPSVELWQALALSLGKNPDRLQYDSLERNFSRLLKIAMAHAKSGNIQLVVRKLNMAKSLVSLPDFTSWLERMPFWVSEQFLSRVKWKAGYENALKLALDQNFETSPVPTMRNSTIKKRRNTLTPVIELAQKQCGDPDDTSEVWAVLLVLAEKRHPPLLGATEQGLQYLKEGVATNFSKKSLGKRLAR